VPEKKQNNNSNVFISIAQNKLPSVVLTVF